MEVLVRTNVVLDGSEDGDPRTISLDDNVIRLNQVLAAHHQLIPAESEIVLPSNMSEVQKDSIWNLELFAQSLARQFDDTAEIAVTEKRNGLDDLTFAEFFPGWDQHVVDAIREFSTTENDGSRTDALTALVAVVTNTDKGQVPQEVWDAAQGGKDILGVLKDPQDRHLFAGNDVAIDQALKVLKGADPDQLNIIFQALGYADSSSNAMLKILGWVAGGALSLASGAGSFLLGKRWLSQTSDGGFGSGDEVSAKSQGL